MKEIRSIIKKYESLKNSNIKMALATVVNVEHSSYRRSGARMLITQDGNWIGGISGGCLEGDTLKKALYAIHKEKPIKVSYDTRDDDPNQIGVGLGCNGLIDVLIVPIIDRKNNPITKLKSIVDKREPSILITNLNDGNMTVYPDITNTYPIEIMNNAEKVKTIGRSQQLDGYFIEHIEPEITAFIFGKNYDVIPFIEIANAVGYQSKVVANPIKISKNIYAIATEIIPKSKTTLPIDAFSVALLMSHDYKTDLENLIELQSYDIKYIGLLGPKSRKDKMVAEIKARGINLKMDNIYGPMGLDTGATTPEEIAISIIAEIRSCFCDRNGNHLRDRTTSIHID